MSRMGSPQRERANLLIDIPASTVAIGLSEDSTHFVSLSAPSSLVCQGTHCFFHRPIRHFGVTLDASFEAIGGQTEAAPGRTPRA